MSARNPARSFQPAAALRRLARGSALLETAAEGREPSPLGWKVRALTAPETLQLERQGCWCQDWTRVRVQEGFETAAVRTRPSRATSSSRAFLAPSCFPGT